MTTAFLKFLIYLVLCILPVSTLICQDIPAKFRAYKAKVKLLNSKKNIVGSIYILEDSSITLINALSKDDIQNYRFQPISIPINEIETMKVRRVGKTGKSMALGAAAGMTLAVTISVAQGPDDCLRTDWCQTVGEKITMYGFLFVPVGSLIGAIAGAPSKTYRIDGSMHN